MESSLHIDFHGGLPKGCEICLRGAKLVLFITGICHKNCYYCPLSEKKKGRDVIYANEVLIEKDLEILLEGRAIDAEGTGITGGDPLLRLRRTLRYIKMLKEFFGSEHHIHLYTNGIYASSEAIFNLKRAGLDEIRFHIMDKIKGLEIAKEAGLNVGVEVPAIPGEEERLKKLAICLERMGMDFLNINQLEFAPMNFLQFKERGFELEGNNVVKGSEELALKIIKWAEEEGLELKVHYCSSLKKDQLQYKMRMMRRRKNIIRPYEEALEDGLIGKFLVEVEEPYSIRRKLIKTLKLKPNMIGVSMYEKGLEIPRSILSEINKILPKAKVKYVKELPTAIRERIEES
ncbi:MAG: radical SAM protein [Candidatus Methanomethyliaceae archaeon]|nr:radical SAM protein [Candidatus Methanomethyliaceae archaeon]MDW7971163.1 radical SAM protein [Nitrososphaerota archaeon]